MKIKTIVASTALLAGGLLGGASTTSASAATPTFCHGFPVDHDVLPGGALFVDPDGNLGSVIMGTSGNDTIHGAGGADIICGEGGADTILGQDGEDFIYGGSGRDTLRGGENDDFIQGEGGANNVKCGQGGGDQADGGAEGFGVPEDDVLQGVDALGIPGSCETNANF